MNRKTLAKSRAIADSPRIPRLDSEEKDLVSAKAIHGSNRRPALAQGWDKQVLNERSQAVIRLLDRWLEEESGYDERVWPGLKQAIEEDCLSNRKRFCA